MMTVSQFKRRSRILCLILLVTVWTGSANSQLNGNDAGIRALAKSWGYYLGQMYRLERIEKTFPDARLPVYLARAEFTSAFPDFESNVQRTYINWGFKEADLVAIRKSMTDSIASTIELEAGDRDSAMAFVDLVRQRAKGREIPEDILQSLLSTSFVDRPEQEVLRGWREKFTTLGHPKAKGVTVLLQTPKSFKQQDGERPNIVAKWSSEAGNGLEMLMLMVLTSDDKPLTRQQIENDIRLGDRSAIRRSFKGTGTIISLQPFSQEFSAGYIVEVQSDAERAGVEMTVRQRQFVLFLPGRAIGFICQVGGQRAEASKLESRMNRLSELCRQVANTLVLPQQYPSGR